MRHTYLNRQRRAAFFRAVAAFVTVVFSFNTMVPPRVYAQGAVFNLPVPGAMVTPSTGFTPALIKGITPNPENPLEFNFIVDTGDSRAEGEDLRVEANKMIKYFLASLTVPEDELWVNLSPYEKDRIVPENFGVTEIGRDMLAQDYILKQLTASLVYPEEELGDRFWKRVRQRALDKFGAANIPVNTFNKVWIVPDKAVVFEHEGSAYVVESYLKVMMEEDHAALNANAFNAQSRAALSEGDERRGMALRENINNENQGAVGAVREPPVQNGIESEILREIIIPEIEREVNEGETFANLRQIYNSMIYAAWFKKRLKESLLGQVYADKNKVAGVDVEDKNVKQKIYEQYLEAFQKGVYDYIKEEYDPVTSDIVPRKYFSGGVNGVKGENLDIVTDYASLSQPQASSFAKDRGMLQNVRVGLFDVGGAANQKYVRDAAQRGLILVAEETPTTGDLAMVDQKPLTIKDFQRDDLVAFLYPGGEQSITGKIIETPSSPSSKYKILTATGHYIEVFPHEIGAISAARKLNPQEYPASVSKLPDSGGLRYALHSAEKLWNEKTIALVIKMINFNRLKERGQNAVILELSSGSGKGSELIAQELVRQNIQIGRISMTDVNTAWGNDLMVYNIVKLINSRLFRDLTRAALKTDHHILRFDSQRNFGDPLALGIVNPGEVDLISIFHGIHLYFPQGVEQTARMSGQALREGGQVIINSGGLKQNRPAGTIGFDTLFQEMPKTALPDILEGLKILERQGWPVGKMINEVNGSINGQPSRWVKESRDKAFPEPVTVDFIREKFEKNGIQMQYEVTPYQLQRDDYAGFILENDSILNAATFPELMLHFLEERALPSLEKEEGLKEVTDSLAKYAGGAIGEILEALNAKGDLKTQLRAFIVELKSLRDSVAKKNYEQAWENGPLEVAIHSFVGTKIGKKADGAMTAAVPEDVEGSHQANWTMVRTILQPRVLEHFKTRIKQARPTQLFELYQGFLGLGQWLGLRENLGGGFPIPGFGLKGVTAANFHSEQTVFIMKFNLWLRNIHAVQELLMEIVSRANELSASGQMDSAMITGLPKGTTGYSLKGFDKRLVDMIMRFPKSVEFMALAIGSMDEFIDTLVTFDKLLGIGTSERYYLDRVLSELGPTYVFLAKKIENFGKGELGLLVRHSQGGDNQSAEMFIPFLKVVWPKNGGVGDYLTEEIMKKFFPGMKPNQINANMLSNKFGEGQRDLAKKLAGNDAPENYLMTTLSDEARGHHGQPLIYMDAPLDIGQFSTSESYYSVMRLVGEVLRLNQFQQGQFFTDIHGHLVLGDLKSMGKQPSPLLERTKREFLRYMDEIGPEFYFLATPFDIVDALESKANYAAYGIEAGVIQKIIVGIDWLKGVSRGVSFLDLWDWYQIEGERTKEYYKLEGMYKEARDILLLENSMKLIESNKEVVPEEMWDQYVQKRIGSFREVKAITTFNGNFPDYLKMDKAMAADGKDLKYLSPGSLSVDQSGKKDRAMTTAKRVPTVLLVEDTDDQRADAANSFRLWGYEVIEAGDGREAFEKLTERGSVDLIITDLQMKGKPMDGNQLIRQLTQEEKYKTTPVVVLSTTPEELDPDLIPSVHTILSKGEPKELIHAIMDGATGLALQKLDFAPTENFTKEQVFARIVSDIHLGRIVEGDMVRIGYSSASPEITGIFKRLEGPKGQESVIILDDETGDERKFLTFFSWDVTFIRAGNMGARGVWPFMGAISSDHRQEAEIILRALRESPSANAADVQFLEKMTQALEVGREAVQRYKGETLQDFEAQPGDYIIIREKKDGIASDKVTFGPFYSADGSVVHMNLSGHIFSSKRSTVGISNNQITDIIVFKNLASPDSAMTARKTVLVVEDDPTIRATMSMLLKRQQGYAVHVVKTGEEAIAFLKANPVGVIVTDLRLNKAEGALAGKELLQAYHAVVPGARIIVFSASAMEDLGEFKPGYIHEIISKGAGEEDVATSVQSALKRKPTILYIDSDKKLGEEVRDALKNYNIVVATREEQAKEIIQNRHVDAVLTELKLQSGDIIPFIRSLDNAFSNLPVFVLAAGTERILNDKPGNVVKVWQKPTSIIDIRDAIQNYIPADSAALAPEPLGGIDLNPALLDLQIKRDGNGVPFPVWQQPIEQMHIEGFLPVIIQITPITVSLPVYLGLGDGGTPFDTAQDEDGRGNDLSYMDKRGRFDGEILGISDKG